MTLLYEDRQVYFGPVSAAKQLFVGLGFVCTDVVSTADFLTSLSNPAERVIGEDYVHRAPRTPEDFELAWRASAEHARLMQEIKEDMHRFPDGIDAMLKLGKSRKAEEMTRGRVTNQIILLLQHC